MKNLNFYLALALLLITFGLKAQFTQDTIVRKVFAAGGGFVFNDDLRLSFTIGQAGLAGSFTDDLNTLKLNVGFQQKDEIGLGINFQEVFTKFKVFPNPFRNSFFLSIESEDYGELSYCLYDYTGKVVLEQTDIQLFKGFIEQIDRGIANLPAGLYNLSFLIFTDKNSPKHVSVKLIKL
jgi:hypothetical protein